MGDNFKLPELPIIGPKRPDEKPEEEKKSENFLCPYKVPEYSGPLPDKTYSFEVLKNGVIVEVINNLHEKPYHVFGRLPLPHVDINSAHPTSSRFHCVLQYKPASSEDDINEKEVEEGWYVYDLDSTHGTFLNKNRIRPKTFVRVRVGHQIKLGNSTRCYILQGPTEDEEEQSEFTITELKQQKLEKEMERKQKELEEKLEQERLEKEKQEEGINWGMTDDAEEEPDLTENPYAQTNNEELFIHDPKKTLRGFFEREGYDLDYRCDELSPGVFICRVELPIDDEFGKPLICEVQHKGKKKECVVNCALEACRILDRHGVLRQANHEPRRKRKVSESDSDDDNFFDRTGDVEKKRLKKQSQPEKEALTYEQLSEQEQEILLKIQLHEEKLNEMIENEKRQKELNKMDDDDLDSFMSHLTDKKIDKFEIRNMKNELQNLKLEHTKIQKLINIVKPSVMLPPISQSKGKLPLFGKRSKLPRDFGVKKTPETAKSIKEQKEFEVEEDDDEEVTETKGSSNEKGENSGTKAAQNVHNLKIEEKTKEVHKVVKKDLSQSSSGESSSKESEQPIKSNSEDPVEKISNKSEIKDPVKPTETKSSSKDPVKSTEKKSGEEKDPVKQNKPETVKNQAKSDKSEPKTSDSSKPEESTTKKSKKPLKSNNRYRANIDINDDDEYIDEDKVSMWLPPENQSGDGTNHLNEKFGY